MSSSSSTSLPYVGSPSCDSDVMKCRYHVDVKSSGRKGILSRHLSIIGLLALTSPIEGHYLEQCDFANGEKVVALRKSQSEGLQPGVLMAQVTQTEICAPSCGGTIWTSCAAPDKTVAANPVCALKDDAGNTYCSLTCEVDLDCPAKGACRNLALVEGTNEYKGICVTPVAQESLKAATAVTVNFQAMPKANWEAIAANRAKMDEKSVSANQLEHQFPILASSPEWRKVAELAPLPVPGAGASGSAAQPAQTESNAPKAQAENPSNGMRGPQRWKPSGENIQIPAETGNVLKDIEHDVKYLEKRILDGDLVQKELHDTWFNITHLQTRAYAILHPLVSLFALYFICGGCLKAHVAKAKGWDVIPHKEFWESYPERVIDGAYVVKNLIQFELLDRICGSSANGISYEPASMRFSSEDNQGYCGSSPSVIPGDDFNHVL